MRSQITPLTWKIYYITYTVKPVLRCQFGTKNKWSSKTGDLLKEIQFILKFM